MNSNPQREPSFIRSHYDDPKGLRAYRHRTSAREGNARSKAAMLRARRLADGGWRSHDLGSEAFD